MTTLDQHVGTRPIPNPKKSLITKLNAGTGLIVGIIFALLTYRWLWSFNVQHPIKQNINSSTIFQNLSAGLTLNYLIKNSKNEKFTL